MRKIILLTLALMLLLTCFAFSGCSSQYVGVYEAESGGDRITLKIKSFSGDGTAYLGINDNFNITYDCKKNGDTIELTYRIFGYVNSSGVRVEGKTIRYFYKIISKDCLQEKESGLKLYRK